MNRLLKYSLLWTALCVLSPSVMAQRKLNRIKRANSLRFSFYDSAVDSVENDVMNTGFFYGGINYINHVNTLGRDNNTPQWGFDPMLGFQKNNTDIYLNGFRWSAANPKYAETDVGISKNWKLSAPLSLTTTYEHAFIHFGTADDRFSLDNLVSTQLDYTNKFVNVDARYEYDWGRNCASILEFSIGHEIDLYDVFVQDKVEIIPRFYVSYLGGNTYPVHFFKKSTDCIVNGTNAFKIANYELELPFTWRKIGDFEWGVSFNFSVPRHVLPEEGTGKSVFFVSSSLVKNLVLHKKHSS